MALEHKAFLPGPGTSHQQNEPPPQTWAPQRQRLLLLPLVLSPWAHGVIWTALSMPQDLNPGASILETQQWLHRHRFSSYCRTLASFTGEAGVLQGSRCREKGVGLSVGSPLLSWLVCSLPLTFI